LGALVTDIGKSNIQQVFSPDIVANPPSESDTKWSDQKTQKAFQQYAVAVGAPEAGVNWPKYARANGYEPTLSGVFQFWKDTIDTATLYRGAEQEEATSQYMAGLGRESESDSAAAAYARTRPATSVRMDTSRGIPLEDVKQRYGFEKLDADTAQAMKETMELYGLYKINPEHPEGLWDREFNNAYAALAGRVLRLAEKHRNNAQFLKDINNANTGGRMKSIDQIISGLEPISLGISGTILSPDPLRSLKVMLDVDRDYE